jgi:hypothetical protein
MEPKLKKTSRKLNETKIMGTQSPIRTHSLRLRPVKWSHMGLRKPDPTVIVAVRYKLKSGIEFDTTFSEKIPTHVPDSQTYYELVDPAYLNLSFFTTEHTYTNFDTMALLGERGETVYLYEF